MNQTQCRIEGERIMAEVRAHPEFDSEHGGHLCEILVWLEGQCEMKSDACAMFEQELSILKAKLQVCLDTIEKLEK